MPDSPYLSMFAPGGSTNYMGNLLDSPELRRQRAFDALGGIGAALIQASAPSTSPQSFTDVFARGLAGAHQGIAGNEDKYLKRALVASQVSKAQEDMRLQRKYSDLLAGVQSPTPNAGGMAQPGYAASTAPLVGTPEQAAIGGVETGGQADPYGAVGPPTQINGQQARPHGKYQVMDFNIGPWTQEVLGKAMTPQEFLASPQAQDAVFNVKFNQFAQQTGSPQGAATMWFTGRPPGPTNTAPDVLGTTPAQYVDKFNQNYQPPVQGAQAGIPSPLPQMPPGAQTLQEVVQKIPPGVRQLLSAMPMKEGMTELLKYAQPNHQVAMDTRTGQLVFADHNDIGRVPYLVPADVAKLANEQRKTAIQERNQDVILGPDGKPMVNPQVLEAKKAVSAAQGTDPGSKITLSLAEDAIKRNSEMQKEGLQAQSAINRLGNLQSLLDQLSTGTFKGTTTDIKAAAKAAGIDLNAVGVGDDVGVTQAARALTNLMALENRSTAGGAGMPGAMSDADRNFLQQASPSINNTPEGNKILIEVKRGDLRRQADVAKYAREYIQSPEFKANPAGLDDYVSGKIAQTNYYSASAMPKKSAMPAPPAGFRLMTP